MNTNQALQAARTALQNFVDKVERGDARSTKSYSEMKAVLTEIDKIVQPGNEHSPYQLASVVAIWLRSALACKEFQWDGDQHAAAMQSLEGFENLIFGELDKRATAQEEILRLHRELAAAKLDAQKGWERANMHFRALELMRSNRRETTLDITKKDAVFLLDLLDNPKKPNDALVKAHGRFLSEKYGAGPNVTMVPGG